MSNSISRYDDVGVHAHDQADFVEKQSSINFNVDVNALINSIANALNQVINGHGDREAFVKTELETVISTIRGRYNIMIFNMRQNYEFNPNPAYSWFHSTSFQGILFGIWVFTGPARFINRGDGGWINWGFYGSFQRDDKTVDFNLRQ